MTGKVITFYSYKGGVGRSQALANVAVSLANRGKHVIAVDMDLESPGIHAFFQPPGRPTAFAEDDLADQDGLLDFLISCSRLPEKRPDVRALLRPCAHPRLVAGSIRLLPAGRLDRDYGSRLQRFSWSSFYEHAHGAGYVDLIRGDLVEDADYVLVDSRTGMTDASYVGTYQLAEIVIVLFALHRQGIAGAARIVRGIRACRDDEGPLARPRRTLLIASRVDESGEEEALQEWTARARSELTGLSDDLLIAPEDRLPYMAAAAFGERIVVGGESSSHLSLAYDRLVQRLLDSTPETAAAPRAASIDSPSDLFPGALAIASRAESLHKEIAAVRLDAINLRGLVTWAHEIARDRAEIESQANRIWSDALHLTSAPPPQIALRTEDAAGLRALSTTLLSMVRETAMDWTRGRLAALAGGDDALLARALDLVAAVVQPLEASAFQGAVVHAEKLLVDEGIEAHLQRNALEMERLRRTFGDDEACSTWLETRLQTLIADADFDVSSRLVLHNLLRLRVASITRAEPHHWLAYDYLCLFCGPNEAEQQVAFSDIGAPLWSGEWRAAFESPAPVGPPTAPEATRALSHVLSTEKALSVIEFIESSLLRASSLPGGVRACEGLFGHLHENLLLVAAIDRIATRATPGRRALAGLWLSVVGAHKATAVALRGFIGALVEDRLSAEAHYAMEALARVRPDMMTSVEARWASLAFLLRAIEQGRGEVVTALLSTEATVRRIVSLPLGRVIIAAYSSNIVTLPGASGGMAAALMRLASSEEAPLLPASTRALSWSERAAGAPTVARTVGSLMRHIEEQSQRRFHATWGDAGAYARAFKAWVDAELSGIMASTSPSAAIDARIERMNAQDWMEEAYQALRERDAGVSTPDGKGRDNIVEAFNAVREALLSLNRLRPAAGTPSLRFLFEEGGQITAALDDLRTFVREGRPEGPLWMVEAVNRLLAEANV